MGVQPGNPIVGGTVLRIPAIQSPNFSTGVSGWAIRIDGSAEFNNLTIRGTFTGTDFIMNAAGIFFYNGAPGSGNLILSLAAVAGADAFGNTFPQGLDVISSPTTMPSMSNGWNIGGHAKYIVDPLGNLIVSWKDLQPGTVTDGTKIWGAGALSVAARPPDNRRLDCYCDNTGTAGAGLEIETDGSVQCYGIGGAATRVDLFAVIPLGF